MWARSAIAGGLATSALLGVDYALSQLDLAPFFPLDAAQAGIKITPGFVATQGIDALGPAAKVLAETTALLVVLDPPEVGVCDWTSPFSSREASPPTHPSTSPRTHMRRAAPIMPVIL